MATLHRARCNTRHDRSPGSGAMSRNAIISTVIQLRGNAVRLTCTSRGRVVDLSSLLHALLLINFYLSRHLTRWHATSNATRQCRLARPRLRSRSHSRSCHYSTSRLRVSKRALYQNIPGILDCKSKSSEMTNDLRLYE